MIYMTEFDSPVGRLTLAGAGEKLVGLWIEGQNNFESNVDPKEMVKNDNLAVFSAAKRWLDRYFSKKRPAISELSLSADGSDFRKAVWRILCQVPYGEVTTYGAVARKIAEERGMKRMSAQAVGGALANNPISIIIPCHRVVGFNGSLIGYVGGINKKIKLLECEGVDISKFWIPKNAKM